ncbi:hypothetical protein DFO70_10625 [Cytobacillus firmus]|uniref:Uncharacterized protein n=2 Tax=Cytobacillus TaxID=2675230 RepID=A0A366JWG1_CYTFI|nr:hypothetical protein DFO70_10625 [Cytobacillus firmus]TDX42498.1 hypothetical protein DFO72_10625 [Cytobacillus oceanisediminis]
MDFFADLFWLLFMILCVCFFVFLSYRQHVMKKEQEYIIKLNHEILDSLKNKERLQTTF